MRFLFIFALIAAAFAVPVVNNISIKAVTSGTGKGSIEVVVGDDEWNFEWEELTDEIKQTVKAHLEDMGIDGGFDENNTFFYNMPDFNFSHITSQLNGANNPSNDGNSETSNTYTSRVTVNNGENIDTIIKEQQEKMLSWVQEYAQPFFESLKAQLAAINVEPSN